MIIALPIPGFADCFADNQGKIIRILNGKMRILPETPNKSHKGYLRVTANGRLNYVHRLVLMAFEGLPPTSKHQSRHLDGNNQNNNAFNLAWGTRKENEADKLGHGTHISQTLPKRSLTDDQIKYVLECDTPTTQLAHELGVSHPTISRIRNNKAFPNIDRSTQVEAKRAPMPRGEKASRARLTQQDVDYIRSSNENAYQLAERFGINFRHVYRIIKGERWK